MATVVTSDDLQNTKIIWNYMKLNHACEKSDIIFCLGSYDIRVAEKAANLFLDGFGKWLLFSGNSGKLTQGVWSKPEAIVFAERAKDLGVPEEKMLIEDRSTNTGENVRFSFELLKDKAIHLKSIIIVQKPYMERRAFATFIKQWPCNTEELRVSVTSPNISLEDYPSNTTGTLSDVICVVIGDFARIRLYEEMGFQIHQEISEDVQAAFECLKATGKYISHMPNT